VEIDLSAIFNSNTQAYREAFVGTLLVRMQKRDADLTLPYIKHGANAYNAREVDKRVVNPFLKGKGIPSSGGPFLSSLRRGVKFVPATAGGIRDDKAFGAFLSLIAYVARTEADEELRRLLVRVLYCFLDLREQSKIPVGKVARLSVPQIERLVDGLLNVKSGGQYPLFIVVATFHAIKEALNLPWDIAHQGINEPDAPGKQPGDITISSAGKLLIAGEVTERVVDKARVVTTFAQKIVPAGVEDYIFLVKFKTAAPLPEALEQAQQYFNQGHEVNFADIKVWLLAVLTTFGKQARTAFITKMTSLLDSEDVKKHLKVAWNEEIQKLTKI